jgi:hypothetical protein
MIASVIVGIILFIIFFLIYIEYQNEKRYQEERKKQRERKKKKLTPKVTKRPSSKPAPLKEPDLELKTQQEPLPQKRQPTALPKQEERTEPSKVQPPEEISVPQTKVETPQVSPDIELPKGEYPHFNYNRLLEMGLSEEEAQEFVQELIPQIGEQIPLIDEAMKIPDFHKMERLTHSIKGSSTNIGTGGVSDLLVDYNTYLKKGEEIRIAQAYQKHLKHYYQKLKEQFSKD